MMKLESIILILLPNLQYIWKHIDFSAFEKKTSLTKSACKVMMIDHKNKSTLLEKSRNVHGNFRVANVPNFYQ